MESKFTAGVLDTIIAGIVASLICGCTLGIATPWAVAYMAKFICDHTIIDGKQLVFDGNGGDLFGKFIKWLLLTIVTFGIYGFWVTVKMCSWVTEHTHYVE